MMKEALSELEAVVKTLAGTEQPSELIEVDRVGFIRFMAKNLEGIKALSNEDRLARLKYLGECLEVAKNFKGPTNGAMKLSVFKDPAQYTTTEKVGGINDPKSVSAAAATTNFGDGQQPSGKPKVPSVSGAIPNEASSSGASFAGGNFSKAIESMQKGIDTIIAMAKDDSEAPAETAAETEATAAETAATMPAEPLAQEETKPEIKATSEDETDEDEVTAGGEVAKAEDLFDEVFPADMNDEDPKIDDEKFFGFDKGSKLEKRHSAKTAV